MNGFTVMHLAAAKGECRVIDALLSTVVSPGFAEANPLQNSYTPCPLYLAASNGHQDAVELFCQLDSCPQSCERDAYLLLAARSCEFRRRLLITDVDILELWDRALSFSEKSHPVTKYQQPIAEYGFRIEITSREAFQDLWHTPDFAHTDAFYQILLVRERCMGTLDKSLIYTF